VKFLTGTDEHGQKVQRAAEKLDLDTQTFVDEKSLAFEKMNAALNISNDDFIRTTQERHKTSVQFLWNILLEAGYIYLSKYAGWYSIRDEAFYNESELTIDKKAPTGSDVEWIEEMSYFFKLSHFQDQLLDFYKANPDFITPSYRTNEVINFVKSGLHDLSISRTTFDWGITVPQNSSHVIYVWLDALANYISALGYPDNTSIDFQNFWPASAHVIGKDILRFHAVYWPAFLLAVGLPLPKKIVAHGWWMSEGEKMSKSIGNVIDPIKIIEDYNVDSFRYFLLREMAFGNDGNFSIQSFILRNNSELANKIGNLLQRSLSLIHKHYEGKIPLINVKDIYTSSALLQEALTLYEKVAVLMENFQFNLALEILIRFTDKMNEYINEFAPWTLLKTDKNAAGKILYIVAEALRYVAILLIPFIPESAEKMLNQLNIDVKLCKFSQLNINHAIKSGNNINIIEPIFKKFE
jgi:methionyl-tRNA synthetase